MKNSTNTVIDDRPVPHSPFGEVCSDEPSPRAEDDVVRGERAHDERSEDDGQPTSPRPAPVRCSRNGCLYGGAGHNEPREDSDPVRHMAARSSAPTWTVSLELFDDDVDDDWHTYAEVDDGPITEEAARALSRALAAHHALERTLNALHGLEPVQNGHGA
jgi:hypothetical protein